MDTTPVAPVKRLPHRIFRHEHPPHFLLLGLTTAKSRRLGYQYHHLCSPRLRSGKSDPYVPVCSRISCLERPQSAVLSRRTWRGKSVDGSSIHLLRSAGLNLEPTRSYLKDWLVTTLPHAGRSKGTDAGRVDVPRWCRAPLPLAMRRPFYNVSLM